MSFIIKNFFLIAIVASILALIQPSLFIWAGPLIPFLLGLIMFGMGLTLELHEFTEVLKNKRIIVVGVFLQFLIMPLLAFLLGKVFHLPFEIYVGVILVGACPGGTASNVMTYLAKGNVAFSIVLTFSTTILAPFVTPAIIYWIVGQKVDVSYWSLFQSLLQIVAFPLLAGLLVKHYLGHKINKAIEFFPAFSTLCISLIIACVMAMNQKQLLSFPYMVILTVFLHNGIGLLLGYFCARLLKSDERDSRTIAIEVGMQNSGLGVALANQFFSPLSALPSAIFSLWHNLSGSLLASYWSKR